MQSGRLWWSSSCSRLLGGARGLHGAAHSTVESGIRNYLVIVLARETREAEGLAAGVGDACCATLAAQIVAFSLVAGPPREGNPAAVSGG